MTDQPFHPEPHHQKLIDGLTALVLTDQLDKQEALQIIAYYNEKHPEASWLDEAVLAQLRLGSALPLPLAIESDSRYVTQSTEELELRLGEINYELRPVRLPFRSFGDNERDAKLSLEAGYIEDELARRGGEMFRHCDWCGERYHADDDWVRLNNGLVVCWPCSVRDIAGEWFEPADAEVDPAEEREWDERA